MADRQEIIVRANSFPELVSSIGSYGSRYAIDKLWMVSRWWPWSDYYYARLVLKPTVKPKFKIKIGPVSMRDLPQRPKPPHLVFSIGPVTARS